MGDTMKTTLTGCALAAKIASKYDAGFEADKDGGYSSIETLPKREAQSLVAELRDAGFEASDVPDHEDRKQAWVYVTKTISIERLSAGDALADAVQAREDCALMAARAKGEQEAAEYDKHVAAVDSMMTLNGRTF